MIVITDRQVLDRQLQDAIYQIEHAQGVVKAIDQDSKQLARGADRRHQDRDYHLAEVSVCVARLIACRWRWTTIDAADEMARTQAKTWEAEIGKRRYAVIVDEAHSSQTGETARELKAILGATVSGSEEDESDWEDRLNQVMASRGRQPNLSFFAYTATPKGKTLELFGRAGSQRQAGAVSSLQHAPSHRGRLYPGCVAELHDL